MNTRRLSMVAAILAVYVVAEIPGLDPVWYEDAAYAETLPAPFVPPPPQYVKPPKERGKCQWSKMTPEQYKECQIQQVTSRQRRASRKLGRFTAVNFTGSSRSRTHYRKARRSYRSRR